MKATMNYRNEKGEFARENVNHGFEVNYDFFTATAKRNGQQSPEQGNNVEVKLVTTKTATPIGFNLRLFDRMLNQYCYNEPQWQYDGKFDIEFTFNAPTWREAFKKAKEYIFTEIAKYEVMVEAREMALIDAEF